MKIIKGDLIALAKAGEFDIIVHGANCMNVMGSGIAKQIREEFPEAWRKDQVTVAGDKSKLGGYSWHTYCRDTFAPGHILTVLNLYTQYAPGTGDDVFEYSAFKKGLEKLRQCDLMGHPFRWGFPLIGCGLAGGNKETILQMLEDEMQDSDVTVVEWSK